MNEIKIFGMADRSRVDGPGLRTVVYLQGCPNACPWCHSPHSQPDISPILFYEDLCSLCGRCETTCRNNVHVIIKGKHNINRIYCKVCAQCVAACPARCLHLPTQIIPIDKLIAKLTPRLALCDGLTLGGGEAIMQDSALDILRYFKKRGVHTCIETAGFADSARYTMFNPFVDTWLFGGLGNVSNAETIRNLGESEIIPTLPLIPGVADNNLQTLMDITIAAKAKQILLNPWNPYYNVYYKAAGIDMPFSPPDNIDITACLNKVTQFLVDNNINYKINSKN